MSIKIELEYVCRGCLSSDRKVEPLKNNANLFFILLADQFIPKDSSYFNIYLCWECVALLRNVAMFQMQIQRSKNIFLQHLDQMKKPLECLTHLSIFHKNNYDEVIEYEEVDNEQDIKLEQLLNVDEVIKEETNDCYYNDEDFFDTDCTDNIMKITDNISNSVDNQETKLKKKRKSIKSVINTSLVINDQVENDSYYNKKGLFDTDCTDNIMEMTDDILNSVDKQETKSKKRKSIKSIINTSQVFNDQVKNDSYYNEKDLFNTDCTDNIIEMTDNISNSIDNQKRKLKKKRKSIKSIINTSQVVNDPVENDTYYSEKDLFDTDCTDNVAEITDNVLNSMDNQGIKLKKKRKSVKSVIKTTQVAYNEAEIDSYMSRVHLNIKEIEKLSRNKRGMITDMSYRANVAIKKILSNKKKDTQKCSSTRTCTECTEIVPDRTSMIEHWSDHTITMYKCNYCTYYGHDTDEMLNHLQQKHTTIYKCKCGAEFRGLRDYFRHNKYLHNTYDCDICKRRFKSKTNIENHMVRKHLPSICTICHRNYANYKMLMGHFYVYHPELKRVNERPYCVECDMRFENDFLYKRHLRSAVAHRPKRDVKVPCPDCGKIFSRKTYMTNHYNLVHVRQSKHYCEICDKYFITGYAIRTHKKFVHEKREKPKDKICEICGRGFFTNRVLTNHKRTHTGERPFMCTYCPAAFAQRSAMKTHERTQHKNHLRN